MNHNLKNWAVISKFIAILWAQGEPRTSSNNWGIVIYLFVKELLNNFFITIAMALAISHFKLANSFQFVANFSYLNFSALLFRSSDQVTCRQSQHKRERNFSRLIVDAMDWYRKKRNKNILKVSLMQRWTVHFVRLTKNLPKQTFPSTCV